MMKLFSLCALLCIGLSPLLSAGAQTSLPFEDSFSSYGGKSAYFTNASLSNDSSHILIASTLDRKIAQFGIGYEHRLARRRFIEASFEGSLLPVFLESDPTVDGTYTAYPNQPTVYTYFPPVRTLGFTQPVATTVYGSTIVYTLLTPGPRQTTYAFAALPIGGRINGLPRSRIQPTFAFNLGVLYAARNIPVDYTSSFNFLAYAGPGVEVFLTRKQSLRFEYLYEHLSNANLGDTNPGIDSATFRLTFSRYR